MAGDTNGDVTGLNGAGTNGVVTNDGLNGAGVKAVGVKLRGVNDDTNGFIPPTAVIAPGALPVPDANGEATNGDANFDWKDGAGVGVGVVGAAVTGAGAGAGVGAAVDTTGAGV